MVLRRQRPGQSYPCRSLCDCIAACPLCSALRAARLWLRSVVFVVERTEPHPGNYSNSESVTGSARRVDSPNRIMIGECQRRETAAVGGLDYLVGWKNAVGCCRVGMQVDKGRPARIPAHCP